MTNLIVGILCLFCAWAESYLWLWPNRFFFWAFLWIASANFMVATLKAVGLLP